MTSLLHVLSEPVFVRFEIAVAAALLIAAGIISVRSRAAAKTSAQMPATFMYWVEAAMSDDPDTRALATARLAALNDAGAFSPTERAAILQLLRRTD